MTTILGGLGYQSPRFYSDVINITVNTVSYTYYGANRVPLAGIAAVVTSHATFTFKESTQQLSYKTYFGLC